MHAAIAGITGFSVGRSGLYVLVAGGVGQVYELRDLKKIGQPIPRTQPGPGSFFAVTGDLTDKTFYVATMDSVRRSFPNVSIGVQ